MVPHADWHHVTVRQSKHTEYSTYHKQRSSNKYLMGNKDDNPNKTC